MKLNWIKKVGLLLPQYKELGDKLPPVQKSAESQSGTNCFNGHTKESDRTSQP